MASSSIPYTGSRVSVHCFVGDIVGPGTVEVEEGVNPQWAAVRLNDGHGLSFTLSGERTAVRMLVAGILGRLNPDPTPSAEEGTA